VELALLSRLAVDVTASAPTLQLVFRNASTVNLVPNFEGQPMIQTLHDQVRGEEGARDETWATPCVPLT